MGPFSSWLLKIVLHSSPPRQAWLQGPRLQLGSADRYSSHYLLLGILALVDVVLARVGRVGPARVGRVGPAKVARAVVGMVDLERPWLAHHSMRMDNHHTRHRIVLCINRGHRGNYQKNPYL